jgi:hypothetical protein
VTSFGQERRYHSLRSPRKCDEMSAAWSRKKKEKAPQSTDSVLPSSSSRSFDQTKTKNPLWHHACRELQPRRMANWWDAASRADKAGRVKIQTSLACRSRRTELRQTAAVAKRRGTDGCQHSAGSCSSVDRTVAECFALRHVYGHVFMSDQAKKKKRSLPPKVYWAIGNEDLVASCCSSPSRMIQEQKRWRGTPPASHHRLLHMSMICNGQTGFDIQSTQRKPLCCDMHQEMLPFSLPVRMAHNIHRVCSAYLDSDLSQLIFLSHNTIQSSRRTIFSSYQPMLIVVQVQHATGG